MNFIGCDGAWVSNGGALSCAGTLYTYTSDEMAQMFNGFASYTGLTFPQLIEYGVYYGLSYAAIIFIFRRLRDAIKL